MPKSMTEGTIRKRRDGRWEARYSVGIDPGTGKYIQRSLYANTQKEIKAKLRAATDALENGISILSNISVGSWLMQWMTEYKANDLRDSTYKGYLNAIELHLIPKIGAVNLQSLTTAQLQKYMNSLQKDGTRYDGKDGGVSPAYILKIRNILFGAMEQAVLNKMITHNPVRGVIVPTVMKPDIEAFTIEQQKVFSRVASQHPLAPFFLLGLASGLRRGELLGLSWDCISFENKTITVKQSAKRVYEKNTKTSCYMIGEVKTFASKRRVPLSDAVIPVLLAHRKAQTKLKAAYGSKWNPHNLVFCSKNGTIIEECTIRRYMNQILREADIPSFSLHSLRHSFATRLLEAGVSPKVVSEFLGHKDVAFTMNTYVHVTYEQGQEDISKLNGVLLEFASAKAPKKPK